LQKNIVIYSLPPPWVAKKHKNL